MATKLFMQRGQMEQANNGDPLRLGSATFYEAGTLTLANTYADAAGAVPNANPFPLDSNGRYTAAVYLDDTDAYPAGYDMVVKDSAGVDIRQMEDIPAATPDDTATVFAAELTLRQQKTAADSPVNLVAADAGAVYEVDTTSGSVVINLPLASAVGNGKGFVFEKTVAANTLTINRAGSDTIDGATSAVLYGQYTKIKISSNGATWYIDRKFMRGLAPADFKSGSSGGAISLSTPASGHTLSGDFVNVDITGNTLRVYESGGTQRGATMDLTTLAGSVGGVFFHSGNPATQAEVEALSAVRAVVPARQQYHPGHPKAWAYVGYTAGVPAILTSYNVLSIADGGVGTLGITLVTAFSSNFWGDAVSAVGGVALFVNASAKTTSTITIVVRDGGGSVADPSAITMIGVGDQ